MAVDRTGTTAAPDRARRPCDLCDAAIGKVLDAGELGRLNGIATAVTLEAGGTAFLEGDDSSYLFNLVSGSLRQSKLLPDGRRQVTGFLFPGDFLGLSTAGTYPYSAEALTAAALCRFDRVSFIRMLEGLPRLERHVLRLASRELAQAHDHLLVLGRKTATERIATVLLKLVARIGELGSAGCTLDLPMSRADLADYTGLTAETVCRTLTQLRKRGVIASAGLRGLHIPRLDVLAGYSGDL